MSEDSSILLYQISHYITFFPSKMQLSYPDVNRSSWPQVLVGKWQSVYWMRVHNQLAKFWTFFYLFATNMVPNDGPMKWELVTVTLGLKQPASSKIQSVSIVSSLWIKMSKGTLMKRASTVAQKQDHENRKEAIYLTENSLMYLSCVINRKRTYDMQWVFAW
jgi:hypothetical protein